MGARTILFLAFAAVLAHYGAGQDCSPTSQSITLNGGSFTLVRTSTYPGRYSLSSTPCTYTITAPAGGMRVSCFIGIFRLRSCLANHFLFFVEPNRGWCGYGRLPTFTNPGTTLTIQFRRSSEAFNNYLTYIFNRTWFLRGFICAIRSLAPPGSPTPAPPTPAPPTPAPPGACECESTTVTKRILNGDNAAISRAPFQVRVITQTSAGFFTCGGTIVDTTHVVTAAHCVDPNAISHRVLFGSAAYNNPQSITAASVVQHPGYNAATIANDIAVITLSSPLTYVQGSVRPACLARTAPASGTAGRTFGWGRTETGSAPNTLQQIDELIYQYPWCNANGGGNNFNPSQLCIDVADNEATCFGDSGGPLVTNGNTLVGVTSFVFVDANRNCNPNLPAGFANVAFYLEWIQTQIPGICVP